MAHGIEKCGELRLLGHAAKQIGETDLASIEPNDRAGHGCFTGVERGAVAADPPTQHDKADLGRTDELEDGFTAEGSQGLAQLVQRGMRAQLHQALPSRLLGGSLASAKPSRGMSCQPLLLCGCKVCRPSDRRAQSARNRIGDGHGKPGS